MSESIAVVVNGRPQRIDADATLAQLVRALGLDERYLVIEWNGDAFAFAEVSRRRLASGDRLELVRPVAGG
jgi:thiamine biosynthesis protein ThiS